MGNVIVVAEVEFKPDRVEDGFAELEQLCKATHASDAGCIMYALHRVTGDPTRAVTIEKWESADALDAHDAAEHIKTLKGFDGFASAIKVLILEPTGFGDAEKGIF